MFIHLGSGCSVRARDIVGIFDMDTCTVSKQTRAFLTAAEKSGEMKNITPDIPKSFIVTAARVGREDNTEERVYVSGISSKTLANRLK